MHRTHSRSWLLAAILALGGIGSRCPAPIEWPAPVDVGVARAAMIATVPTPEMKGWTKHLVWIVPLAFLLMILVLLMRRSDDE